MKTFHCIVLERYTHEALSDYIEVEIDERNFNYDEYDMIRAARFTVVNMIDNNKIVLKNNSGHWYIDSID